jgi:hypothetical protein
LTKLGEGQFLFLEIALLFVSGSSIFFESLISIVIGKLLSLSKFGIELICETLRLGFSVVVFSYLAGAFIIMSSLKTELTRLIFGFIGNVIFSKGLVKS